MEKYDNLGMVGEGSYGMVMKCKHKESGQIVAIKKFLESEDDKMVKKIAMREVRMLRKLRHENLVNLIEVFRRRKRLYLVFEFVDHTVLDDLEKYPNGLSEMSVRKILWQVLRGVEFCHSHNIIHRDIKPENILNSRNGVIKLCDFGFARTLAAPGEVYTDYVATRWYRAPELLVGDTKYGRGVDIWAVGCLVGEMLQGDPIFPGKSDIDQLSKILKCVGNLCPRHREIFQRNPLFAGMRLPDVRDIEPLEKKFPKFSSEVLDLMKQCLRLDPNDRPSSSLLLRHEFFKKDNFEEKVIPELRARILKDTANNMLARKEVMEKKELEKEKKKKKSKEAVSNTTQENKESDSSLPSKKSPDQKSVTSNSPNKVNTPSPKKENAVKSIMKTPVNSDTSTTEEKKPRKNSEKEQRNTSLKNLPAVDTAKQSNVNESSASTPRPKLPKNSPKEPPKTNMPQLVKKKSKDENLPSFVNTSRDGSISTSSSNGMLKGSPARKSSLKREAIVEASENHTLQSPESKSAKLKNKSLIKTSSDTLILKERSTDAKDGQNPVFAASDKSPNLKSVNRKDVSKKTSKQTESPSRQGVIPPISHVNASKTATPDSTTASNSSPSTTPTTNKDNLRNVEKAKKSVASKKNDIMPQRQRRDLSVFGATTSFIKSNRLGLDLKPVAVGSFDRNMYPDKTSHFEKMMMSMSNKTSITHPALMKSNAAQPSQPGILSLNSTSGTTGPSGMQYFRHVRDDKPSGLPLWSSVAGDEKTPSVLQSSIESNPKREKSPKQSKKHSKTYSQLNESKQAREQKADHQTMRLPDLAGYKIPQIDRDLFPTYRHPGADAALLSKPKKTKSKTLIIRNMPSLDHSTNVKQQRSRSPSPPNLSGTTEGNFPSVHTKN